LIGWENTKSAKACFSINTLADVGYNVVEEIVRAGLTIWRRVGRCQLTP
jgi:hypothetical protein